MRSCCSVASSSIKSTRREKGESSTCGGRFGIRDRWAVPVCERPALESTSTSVKKCTRSDKGGGVVQYLQRRVQHTGAAKVSKSTSYEVRQTREGGVQHLQKRAQRTGAVRVSE